MAWHLIGSLDKDSYDREYSDLELIKRSTPYLLRYKLLMAKVFVSSILDSLFTLIGPLVFAFGVGNLVSPSPNFNFIVITTVSYLLVLVISWFNRYYYSVEESND